jgi:hypothetical protein
MARLIAVIVLTFMLAGPTYVEATCAWVLWEQQSRQADPTDSGRWTIVRAVPGREDCELQLRAEVHRAGEQQKPGTGRPSDGDSAAVVAVTQFHCLPDTIDPRGPKGVR